MFDKLSPGHLLLSGDRAVIVQIESNPGSVVHRTLEDCNKVNVTKHDEEKLEQQQQQFGSMAGSSRKGGPKFANELLVNLFHAGDSRRFYMIV